jgi:hypothetical protein
MAKRKGQTTIYKPKYVTKERLKIPKEPSESAYRRRTDNKMVKRKKYERTNKDLQNIHIKTCIN